VDNLDHQRILEGLETEAIGRTLHLYDEVTSTNDVAMALAEGGAAHGAAVVAERQSGGRGRFGRVWASPPRVGLWVSVVLRPRVPAAAAPTMTLVAGIAAAEAIELAAGAAVAVKWPNDLLLDGRKVAGILTELRTTDQTVEHLVVGIGINVHQALHDFPPDLAHTAISIRLATGRAISRVLLLRHLFARLEAWVVRLGIEGPAPVVAAAATRMPMLGCPVVVVSGPNRWEGTAAGLDADGALVLELPGGRTRRVLAAEVTLKANDR
jgi:BirA family biotin operon repressor/biotin-[acetyl-CoA-carboxylase] ligase